MPSESMFVRSEARCLRLKTAARNGHTATTNTTTIINASTALQSPLRARRLKGVLSSIVTITAVNANSVRPATTQEKGGTNSNTLFRRVAPIMSTIQKGTKRSEEHTSELQ